MYIREVKNRSGSISIQIISKDTGRYQVVKTVGCGVQRHEIDQLKILARQEIKGLQAQPSLFQSEHDEQVEGVLSSLYNSNISVVFYDMTTLYFEASDADDLRKMGFSKDGKDGNPQILIGLLVGLGGYAIGYDIFEGNTIALAKESRQEAYLNNLKVSQKSTE